MKSKGLDSVYSWFIAVAVALELMLSMLPLKMNGLFFVACLERYNTDRKLATLPFTLVYIIRCGLGPIVPLFEEFFGLRNVILIGFCSSALGIFFCFFAEGITTVIISYGVVFGFGITLASCLLPKLVKQHFEKYFSVAIGVVFAIPYIGTIGLYPLVDFLLKLYGLSGTFLIISGLVFNGVPISILFRDPKYRSSPPEAIGNIEDSFKCATAENVEEETALSISETKTDKLFKSAALNMNSQQIKNRSTVSLSCASDENESIFLKTIVPTKRSLPDIPLLNVEKKNSTGKPTQKLYNKNFVSLSEDALDSSVTDKNVADKNIYVLANEKLSSKETKLFHKQNEKDCAIVDPVSKSSVMYKLSEAFRTIRVLGTKPFILIALAQSFFSFIVHIFLTVIIDASRDKGVPQAEAVYFLTFLPIAELSGSFALGWIVDRGCLTKERLAASCFIILGLSCEIFVWTDNFYTLMLGVLLFGFFESGFNMNVPCLIFEYIEECLQSMAFSSTMMFFLPLGFSVPSVIGYFRGTMGTYDNIYHFLTAVNLVGCGLVMLLPFTRKSSNHE